MSTEVRAPWTVVTLIARHAALRARAASALADGVELRLISGPKSAGDITLPKRSGHIVVEAGWPEGRLLADRLAGGAGVTLVDPHSPIAIQVLVSPSSPHGAAELHHANAEADIIFLIRLDGAIDSRLSDSTFGVVELSAALGVSSRQLLRSVSRLTGQTVSDRLRQRRLQVAHELLRRGAYATVAEVAASVGMSASHFTRSYTALFGATPTALRQRRVHSGEEPSALP